MLLTHKDYKLKEHFVGMYKQLLKSIADDEVRAIHELPCENNLYKEIQSTLPDVFGEIETIEVVNEDNEVDAFEVSLVDFHQYFGASIDRDENIQNAIRSFGARRKAENISFYTRDFKEYGQILSMNVELIIRIESNTKLNLIDKHKNHLIQDEDEKEVHFMRLESVTSEYPIQLSTLWKIVSEYFKKDMKFKQWVLTDFDNCLNGNPHIV
eukprot:403357719